jgi:hypothetical protein
LYFFFAQFTTALDFGATSIFIIAIIYERIVTFTE